jgi:hypothetical protein
MIAPTILLGHKSFIVAVGPVGGCAAAYCATDTLSGSDVATIFKSKSNINGAVRMADYRPRFSAAPAGSNSLADLFLLSGFAASYCVGTLMASNCAGTLTAS